MRLINRALHALRYHRWAFAIFALIAAASAGAILIQTAAVMNQANLQGFTHRLTGLNQTAGRSLIRTVTAAYQTLDHQYQLTWWASFGVVLLFSAGFGWVMAVRRKSETLTYLTMGKSSWNVALQAMLEAAIVFTVAYWLAAGLLTLLADPLTGWLHGLNASALTDTLADRVSKSTFSRIMTKLFAHKVTGFNGSGLMAPHPGPAAQTLVGSLPGYGLGLLASILGTGVTTGLHAACLRWQMAHQRVQALA